MTASGPPNNSESLHSMLTIIGWIVEMLWDGFCGWVGHTLVKVITFGKVELDYGASSEGIVTESIGAAVLFAIVVGVWVGMN